LTLLQKTAAANKDYDAAIAELMHEVCLSAASSQHSEGLIRLLCKTKPS